MSEFVGWLGWCHHCGVVQVGDELGRCVNCGESWGLGVWPWLCPEHFAYLRPLLEVAGHAPDEPPAFARCGDQIQCAAFCHQVYPCSEVCDQADEHIPGERG